MILDAAAQTVTVEQSELEGDFQRIAEERWAKVCATGESVPFDRARAYPEARRQGQRPARRTTQRLTG